MHCAVLGGGALLYLLSATYRMNRIIAWLDPWEYEKTLGYQTVQSLIAIGSGGILGQGIGDGVSKFSYLPEAIRTLPSPYWLRNGGCAGLFLSCSCSARSSISEP